MHVQSAYLQLLGGCDSTTKPHLLGDGKWRVAHNVRGTSSIAQVPRKALWATLPVNGDNGWVTAIVPLGIRSAPFSKLIALTNEGPIRIVSASSQNFIPQAGGGLESGEGTYKRWCTRVYKNNLYFVNELNRVHYTDGDVCRSLTNSPAGRYLEVWFDHIVVGAPVISGSPHPTQIRWSHLYDFNQWSPASTNEADFYDVEEWSSGVSGLTGLARLGENLVLYTPEAILLCAYVGLPKVVRLQNVVEGVGCSLRYGLVVADGVHYFPSLEHLGVYRFSAEGLTPVGEPIAAYVAATMSADPALQQRTWGYYDKANGEIVWVFCSTASTGAFDKAVAFNTKTGAWTTRDCEDVQSFTPGCRLAKVIEGIATTYAAAVGTIESNADSGISVPALYGTRWGEILRDEVAGDLDASLYECGVPVLETGDQLFGGIQGVKEVDTLDIAAGIGNSAGVDVEHSARAHLDSSVVFKDSGIWTPSLPERHLSFPRTCGGVFRFRFKPRTTGSASGGGSATLTKVTTTDLKLLTRLWTHRVEYEDYLFYATHHDAIMGADYEYDRVAYSIYDGHLNDFYTFRASWEFGAAGDYPPKGHEPNSIVDYPADKFWFPYLAGAGTPEPCALLFAQHILERYRPNGWPGGPKDYWKDLIKKPDEVFRSIEGLSFSDAFHTTSRLVYYTTGATDPYRLELALDPSPTIVTGYMVELNVVYTYWV